ncbi:MAG: tetratricopeptide repeat protein [Bryobacterales bacterium]|nr:tetratricopeptide repeat protein [Bryobacterales bacterium]
MIKLALDRLLAPIGLLTAALICGTLLKAQPAPQEGQLDGSQALFTVLAAINSAGYNDNLDSNANSPLRRQVREAIARKHLDSVDAIKKFIAEHHQENPEAELSQYISFALSLEGPPDFQFWLPPQEIPPDVRKLDGLNELIAAFYKEARIEDLWKQSQPELERVIAAYHTGITQALLEVNAYLRNPTSGLRGSRFQVYVDLLGAPNQIQTRSYKDRYFVVVTPSPEPQIDQVRHAYLHYLLDPLSLRFFEQWNRDKSLADYAQPAPALDDAYKNDFMLLATECVIKAVESRLAHGAERQALVNQALSQGFVLTPALADGLAVYEKQPESLRIYFPDLLGQINLEHEDRRLQNVAFAKETTVHKAKAAPAPPAPVLSVSAKTLEDAEKLYADRNMTAARESYRKVLEQPGENPVHARAYYGLARIAALDHDPELAERLFQKTLEMSPDDETKSWAYLYLGRLSDAAGEREQAEKQYRAALAVHGAPEQVKVAAEKGLAQRFQR